MSSYGFAVLDDLPSWWDAALARGNRLVSSERWLRAWIGRISGEPRVFMLSEAGQPTLGLFGTVIRNTGAYETFNVQKMFAGDTRLLCFSGETDSLRRSFARAAPDPARWFPNLVVMYPGYECYPVGPNAESVGAVGTLVREVLKWARDQGLKAVGFLYTARDSGALEDALTEADGFHVPIDYRADFRLRGYEQFNDYLAALSANRRHSVRQEIRRLRAGGVQTTRAEFVRWRDACVRLRCSLLRKYGHHVDERVEADRLDTIARHFQNDLVVFCALAGDDLVSCCLFASDEKSWQACWAGTQYAHPSARWAYFDVCFYAPIQEAIRLGVQTIGYGPGSAKTKGFRGCDLVPLNAWLVPADNDFRDRLTSITEVSGSMLEAVSTRRL